MSKNSLHYNQTISASYKAYSVKIFKQNHLNLNDFNVQRKIVFYDNKPQLNMDHVSQAQVKGK